MPKTKLHASTPRPTHDTVPAPPPEHLIAATRVPGRRRRTKEESGLLKIIREVLAKVA